MSDRSKVLPMVAVVVSAVVCLPAACCLGLDGLANMGMLFVDPAMIEAAAGSGPVPASGTFVATGGVSLLGALVALGAAVGGLVWGIRALRRISSQRAVPPTG